MQQKNNKYDLEERTTVFSENLIDFYKMCQKNVITMPLIDQGLRSGTSMGANYSEANGASSRKDFKNKICICKKEGKETQYWLRLIGRTLDDDSLKVEYSKLKQEAHELTLIFSKIIISTK